MQGKALNGGVEQQSLSQCYFRNFKGRNINDKIKLNVRIFPMIEKYLEH